MGRTYQTLGILILLGIPGRSPGQGEVVLRFGSGPSVIRENIDSARNYEVFLLTMGVSKLIGPLSNRIGFRTSAEIQFGIAQLQPDEHVFDAALTLSGVVTWNFSQKSILILSIGTGPGYQSSASGKQAKGFVFSNHIAFGVELVLLHQHLYLTPQVRYRHMSNARLAFPNGGIDHIFTFVHLGIPLYRS